MLKKDILKRILEIKERNSENEENEFLSLVESLEGICTLDDARILMKTFLSKPDYGTQESVIGTISSAGDEVFIRAILEELPRLTDEAPDWIPALLIPEIKYHSDLVIKILQDTSLEIQKALKDCIGQKDFRVQCPEASELLPHISF